MRELVEGDHAIRLHDRNVRRLENELRVTLGPAVDSVVGNRDGLVVRFKRYLSPLALSGAKAEIVDSLTARKTPELAAGSLLASSGAGMDTLRDLEEARVLCLQLPPDALAVPAVRRVERDHG